MGRKGKVDMTINQESVDTFFYQIMIWALTESLAG